MLVCQLIITKQLKHYMSQVNGSSTNFNSNVKSVIQIKTLPIDKILTR